MLLGGGGVQGHLKGQRLDFLEGVIIFIYLFVPHTWVSGSPPMSEPAMLIFLNMRGSCATGCGLVTRPSCTITPFLASSPR